MAKPDISFEVESFLEDEEIQRRSRRVNFEVLPMLAAEEECRNGLHDFLQVERPSGGKEGYARGIQRGFDPLTDKDKTEKYIHYQHKFAHGAVDEEHFIAGEHREAKLESRKSPSITGKMMAVSRHLRKIFEDVVQHSLLSKLMTKELQKNGYSRLPVDCEIDHDRMLERKIAHDYAVELHITHDHAREVLHEREAPHFRGRAR